MPGKRKPAAEQSTKRQTHAGEEKGDASRSVKRRVAAAPAKAKAKGAGAGGSAGGSAPSARSKRSTAGTAAKAPAAAAPLVGNPLSLGNIFSVMKEEGPVVKCVVVASDGTFKQIELDMTPRKNASADCLGGRVTFLGQYASLGVVVMARLDAEEAGLPRSKASLKRPFHEAEVFGDVLLVRMDANATPVDFTLEEYEAFVPTDADDPLEEEEEEEEEDEEEEEGTDDDDLAEDDDEEAEEESEGDDDEEGDEDAKDAAEDSELRAEGEQCIVM